VPGQAQQTQSKEEECGRFFRRRVRLWDPRITHPFREKAGPAGEDLEFLA